jgi:flagellar L-ring protein precursor FlgH
LWKVGIIRNDMTERNGYISGAGAPRSLARLALVLVLSVLVANGAFAAGKQKDNTPKKADPASSALDAYLQRVHALNLAAPASEGSTWSDTGRLSRLMSDVRAYQRGDLIDVVVTESIVSTATGTITGSRQSAATSQLTALLSAFSKSSSASNLLGQTSTNTLTGSSQAANNSTLTTTLGGTVVEVMPNGVMVIEAARQVVFSHHSAWISAARGRERAESGYLYRDLEHGSRGQGQGHRRGLYASA